MELTSQQQHILDRIKEFMSGDASVFILRGYAGTGKTTMVRQIAEYVSTLCDVMLMAPTGRAARILGGKTGMRATTIHKGIYSFDRIETGTDKTGDMRYVFPVMTVNEKVAVIVDEASMLSSRNVEQELFAFGTGNLMEDLLTFSKPSFGGKLIFVGDPAQLPPVGENVSQALNAEYFASRGMTVMEEELTEVLRQDGGSLVLKNSMKIRTLLESETRNNLVFEEKEGEVVSLGGSKELLDKFLETRSKTNRNDCVMICFSNRSAMEYNKEIRARLYDEKEPELKAGDILMVVQNNYKLDRMNGEFVLVKEVGERRVLNTPVYVQEGGRKVQRNVRQEFVRITVNDASGNPCSCLLLLDLLNNAEPSLTSAEMKALYINFRIRNPKLEQGSKSFADALEKDEYYNCLRAKYGYAVTGHKCQGGEWANVFVDYSGRTGLSDDCLRWAYTATTRSRKTLYIANLPHITPFEKFRMDSIGKCKKIDEECRVFDTVEKSPFHADDAPLFLRAKYVCVKRNLEYSQYSVERVESLQYKEIYSIMTPDGVERYDITYNAAGIFRPAVPEKRTPHTVLIKKMLDSERAMPLKFGYVPSGDVYARIYTLIRSVCDGLNVLITNVVEHEDYSVNYYLYTSGTLSYIKFYVTKKGFITYAKPQSLLGTDDIDLQKVVDDIQKHFME